MAALTSDLLRHFWLLLWNRWTEFNETLTRSKLSTSSTKFVFFGLIGKTRLPPWPLISSRHFRLLLWNRWTEFNETWQEARSQCLLPSLCFSGRSVSKNVCHEPMADSSKRCYIVLRCMICGPLGLLLRSQVKVQRNVMGKHRAMLYFV